MTTAIYTFGQTDSLRSPEKFRFTALPVVSFSPETNFKFGLFSYSYFDIFKHEIPSRPCRLKLGGTYSLRKQANVEVGWVVYTKNEAYISEGEIEFSNWIDRNYGVGNDANALTIEYDETGLAIDTFNFLNYKIDFFSWKMAFSKKVKKGWFVGVNFDFEQVYNYSTVSDSVQVFSPELFTYPIMGQRLGFGFNLVYDTRKYIGNPLAATYVQLTNTFYGRVFNTDFSYHRLQLDARKYFNLYKKQSLALRFYSEHLLAKSDLDIPLRALPKLGGKRLIRGYFSGTYQDRNLVAIETEYRIPLWQDEAAPTWKVWKHFGVVAFASAGKVYPRLSDFNFKDFRVGLGAGIRISISPEQRSNIRIDYGIGLAPNAAGLGQKQRSVYITINEAF